MNVETKSDFCNMCSYVVNLMRDCDYLPYGF